MRLDRTHGHADTASAILVALAALVTSACNRELSCTTEVTAGQGTFRGTTAGTRSEADIRRESLRIACGEMCAAGGSTKADGCVSRCAVDVESKKIGARTTCKEGGSR